MSSAAQADVDHDDAAGGSPAELSADVLAAVRRIQMRARRAVDDVLAGQYLSTFRGVGMEFDEVRVYAPGDDVRTIDWNVTARTGVPHIKRFHEEREQTVLLVVDVSGSAQFGSGERSREEVAAELCAVLALAATVNDDKVGLLLHDTDVARYVPPKKGRRHVLRVIREVLTHDARGTGTRLDLALAYARRVQRRHATVFVVSDFLIDDAAHEDLRVALSIAARRHDVVGIALEDPREAELPAVGLVELGDLETGERVLVDTSSRQVREAWAARAVERARKRRETLRRAGVDEIVVDVRGDWVAPLVRFFRKRTGRARARA